MGHETMISVIVPVYNAELYLRRCIDSILNQTYRNFEVILIDDGSKDGSSLICDEYAYNDTRVRVIHKKNEGVSATRNIGIEEAKGEYISFVDSDDYIDINMLEKMYKTAIKNNSDIVMCEFYVDKGGSINLVKLKYEKAYLNKQDVKEGLLYLYYTNYHAGLYSLCNKLIKKNVYKNNNIIFDVTLKRGEDAWFVFECLKDCLRVDFVADAYYYYCQNECSIMHTVYEDQYEKWVETRKRLLKENEKLKFEIDYNSFYKEFLYKVVIYCRALAKQKKYALIKQIISDETFLEASRYRDELPFYVKAIIVICRISTTLGVFCFKILKR